MRHIVKTWKPYFADVKVGRKPFEFRINDRDYKEGDIIVHREFDAEKQEETGEQCYCDIGYVLKGGQFGIPEGYVIFAQFTMDQQSFLKDYNHLSKNILPGYESKLSWRRGDGLTERVSHVLSQLSDTTEKSILQAKAFVEDCKTQFKALEIVLEGVSAEGYNHGQKRVIANHVISMLRDMVDKVDNIDWEYTNGMNDRYSFFRSNSPEHNLLRKYKEMQQENNSLKLQLKRTDVSPDPEGIPF